MMQNAVLRKFLAPLRGTPLHPQWFIFRNKDKALRSIGSYARGNILDIGAGAMELQKYVAPESHYTSLDYYETAVNWYKTRPHVFGNAQFLPIKSSSMDTVYILDVLEHLPNPAEAIKEIRRVLSPGGRVIIQVPFLYPMHDSPYDFQRWTINGLRNMAAIHGFMVIEETTAGNPMETASLLWNTALSKTLLNWISSCNPMTIFLPIILLSVPALNLLAMLLSLFSKNDSDFMSHSIRCVWTKSV